MAYCGSRPGYCGGKQDCGDHYCPGRPEATPMRWVSGAEEVDNGMVTKLHRVHADEPVTKSDEPSYWAMWALLFAAVAMGVISLIKFFF